MCRILHIRVSGIDFQKQVDEYLSSMESISDMELDRESSLEMFPCIDETSTRSHHVLPIDKSADICDPSTLSSLSFETRPVCDYQFILCTITHESR